MPKLLYGIHDEAGQHLVPPGGWCVALASLSERSYPVLSRPDIHYLLRVNWGYGSTGTIPLPHDEETYLNRLDELLEVAKPALFIIGNEPNHEQERPQGQPIEPERYADFFLRCAQRVRSAGAALAPAAVAPYHANPIPWVHYQQRMLQRIVDSGFVPAALTCHAYTRQHSPQSVHDVSVMSGVLSGTFSGFFTYRDMATYVPLALRSLPIHITEFNPIAGWRDENNHTVRSVYREIDWWNKHKETQKFVSLSLFRYAPFDKQWDFSTKHGVVSDFLEAITESLSTDVEAPRSVENKIYVPSIIKAPKEAPSPSVAFERDIDIRAKDRGVSWVEVPHGPAWRIRKIQWFNEQEADRVGPDHHILFDVLNEQGKRVVGVTVKVIWPTGFTTIVTEAKPGELAAANYQMSASRNDYSAIISASDIPSEMVRGIGMGMDTPSGFNAGMHTTTLVVFQRSEVAKNATGTPVKEAKMSLKHPVSDPTKRQISQIFGVNRADYSRFSVDGVPLLGHNGVDFATPVGTEILAVDSGWVAEVAEDAPGYGKYIKIIHAWGESLYAHLSVQGVVFNQRVMRGERIALSGNTGNSTGPHLHFGLRINPYSRKDGWGGYTDPLPYLQEQEQAGDAPPAPKSTILEALRTAANESGLEFELLASLAWAESSFKSEEGDGLLQVGDAAWQDFARGVGATNRQDALDNARVGADYLRWLLARFDNNLWKALSAYNMGPNADLTWENLPELTRTYVNKVIHGRDLLKVVKL